MLTEFEVDNVFLPIRYTPHFFDLKTDGSVLISGQTGEASPQEQRTIPIVFTATQTVLIDNPENPVEQKPHTQLYFFVYAKRHLLRDRIPIGIQFFAIEVTPETVERFKQNRITVTDIFKNPEIYNSEQHLYENYSFGHPFYIVNMYDMWPFEEVSMYSVETCLDTFTKRLPNRTYTALYDMYQKGIQPNKERFWSHARPIVFKNKNPQEKP